MTDRGVSEVLGFVLIFSLVTASVGAVYVVGFGGLEDARDAERIDNAERAMDVLADNVEDIHRDDAPTRATEIKLYDATLSVGESTNVAVNVTNNATGVTANWNNVSVYPVEYAPQRSPTRLRYVNGGVFREDRNGGLLLNRPPVTMRTNSSGDRIVVIPILQTRPGSSSGSISGRTTVLVRTERISSRVLSARTDPGPETPDPHYNVTYRIETTEARAPLWEDYLDTRFDEAFGTTPCSTPSPDTVECQFETQQLFVTVTRINVNVES
jgi:AraC-like DNA-binding protein